MGPSLSASTGYMSVNLEAGTCTYGRPNFKTDSLEVVMGSMRGATGTYFLFVFGCESGAVAAALGGVLFFSR